MTLLPGDPEGWNIAFYFFTSMRGLFLFTVVVLIGTGWSFLKPFLNDREKKAGLRSFSSSFCSSSSFSKARFPPPPPPLLLLLLLLLLHLLLRNNASS
jgi:hypothetical protein